MVKFLPWLLSKCWIEIVFPVFILAIALACGTIAYAIDRGLHAVPKGYEASQPVLIEERELLPLKEILALQGIGEAYLIDSGADSYVFYYEGESEFANEHERVYLSQKISRLAKIIETSEGTPRFQVFKKEYKGISSFWSFAMKTYEEEEFVIRIPKNAIIQGVEMKN